MLLTIANKNAAKSLVENDPQNQKPLPDATRKRILNSTVKLDGTIKAGGGNFTGSGVIFNVDQSKAYILTAAHNVMKWAGVSDLSENWDWAESITGFLGKIKVSYGRGNNDMSFNTDPTGTVTSNKLVSALPPAQGACNNRANCLYDVLVITTTDNNFRTFAINSVFGGQSLNQIKTQVEQEATTIINSFATLLDSGSYHYIQLGYGNTIDDNRQKQYLDEYRVDGKLKKKVRKGDKWNKGCEGGTGMVANRLHYRLAPLKFKEVETYYDQEADAGQAPWYSEWPSIITLQGKAASTTAPGDSGGPLYAVDKETQTKAYLLGVTTGADMEADEKPNSWVFKYVHSTSLSPFFKDKFPDLVKQA